MSAGDDEARALGIDVTRVRLLLILAATVMTVTHISLSGIVSWVELLISHIVRMLIGLAFPLFSLCAPWSAVATCWPWTTSVAPSVPQRSDLAS
jgi:ABC-type Fe3+-siderophore transport system permease subunit